MLIILRRIHNKLLQYRVSPILHGHQQPSSHLAQKKLSCIAIFCCYAHSFIVIIFSQILLIVVLFTYENSSPPCRTSGHHMSSGHQISHLPTSEALGFLHFFVELTLLPCQFTRKDRHSSKKGQSVQAWKCLGCCYTFYSNSNGSISFFNCPETK